MQTTSVILVGVGGQGILLASEIVARAALAAGFDVKTNEVHGMAQRGGSVVAQIRFGEKVYGPLIPKRSATVFGSLERMEALRYVAYLAEGGLAVISDQKIIPVTASSGKVGYPEIDEKILKEFFPRLLYLDVVGEAVRLGNPKTANAILLGAMSRQLQIPVSSWEMALRTSVREKFLDINLKAFEIGRNIKE